MKNAIKVAAPATISNLNCGFDILGVALDVNADEVKGRLNETGEIEIRLVGAYAKSTPKDPSRNTLGIAIQNMLQCLGLSGRIGIEVEIVKKIRPGSGLGTSASSACAGVYLVNKLLGNPLDVRDLLPFAVLGEGLPGANFHADNVAPCLLGGFMLVNDLWNLEVQRLMYPKGLAFAVIYPEIRVLTSESRGALKKSVAMHQMTQQSGNIAGLVHGLALGDLELIGKSMVDHIIEPQRMGTIPGYLQARDAAFGAGAISFGISGSGPTVFALCTNDHDANIVAQKVSDVFEAHNLSSESFVSRINDRGTYVC